MPENFPRDVSSRVIGQNGRKIGRRGGNRQRKHDPQCEKLRDRGGKRIDSVGDAHNEPADDIDRAPAKAIRHRAPPADTQDNDNLLQELQLPDDSAMLFAWNAEVDFENVWRQRHQVRKHADADKGRKQIAQHVAPGHAVREFDRTKTARRCLMSFHGSLCWASRCRKSCLWPMQFKAARLPVRLGIQSGPMVPENSRLVAARNDAGFF